MTFRIVLTVLFWVGAGIKCVLIDQPRKPFTLFDALLDIALSAVLTYGVWHWL